jgi:hypothetical protein
VEFRPIERKEGFPGLLMGDSTAQRI